MISGSLLLPHFLFPKGKKKRKKKDVSVKKDNIPGKKFMLRFFLNAIVETEMITCALRLRSYDNILCGEGCPQRKGRFISFKVLFPALSCLYRAAEIQTRVPAFLAALWSTGKLPNFECLGRSWQSYPMGTECFYSPSSC